VSFTVPGGYPALDAFTTDQDIEVTCRGCRRLSCFVSNQAVYITFGQGDPPQYGQPEPYPPFAGQLLRDFDAFKVRSYTAGQPANVKLIPLPWPH
jgi:hypothetical protein